MQTINNHLDLKLARKIPSLLTLQKTNELRLGQIGKWNGLARFSYQLFSFSLMIKIV